MSHIFKDRAIEGLQNLNQEEVVQYLGETLRDQRLIQKMSQGELAERAKVSLATVKRVEQGRDVALSTWVALTQALGHIADLQRVFETPRYRTQEDWMAAGIQAIKPRLRAPKSKVKP